MPHFPTQPVSGFPLTKEFFELSIEAGAEGIMLKNLDSTDQAGKRRRDGWVKVKHHIEFEAYVVGFGRGNGGHKNQVGYLEFAVMTPQGEHIIGCPSAMTDEFRRKVTTYDPATDTVTLAP